MSDSRIKPIDRTSVHRIHSGQVVLDLQGAIKELVENALDAGATSVEVRIKDSGLESVEVVDNGSGIAQEDWSSIGLKHHTSKLPSLEELAQVSTFGFRGEALSALCALCESVTVTTATKETAPMGAVITLGKDGKVLDDTGRVARQRGTTVTLAGLFKPLPVRRKEFERTAKREFTKALGILTAYALVPASASPSEDKKGVRLRVESVGGGRGGKRNTVLSTDGRGALRSSVTAVWGPKALEGVVDLDLELDVEIDKAMARREGIDATSQTVRVCGLISSGAWGQGRSSTDRQFTYMNGRPCVLPKILKAVNEVYKSFNTNQHPLAILDFQIPRESVDINVSPDKRTIMVHSEANLIEALKTALETFFQPTRSTYAVHGASSTIKLLQAETKAEQEKDEDEGGTEGEAGNEDEQEDAEETLQDASGTESDGETERSPPSVRSSSRRSASTRRAASPVRRAPSPKRSTSTRVIQQTLDTSVASWSQSTQRPSSRNSRPAPAAIPKAPSTGRQARADLRAMLAGYASQPVDLTQVSDAESDDLPEPQPEEEADELEEDDVEMVGKQPSPSPSPAPETAESLDEEPSTQMPLCAQKKKATNDDEIQIDDLEESDPVAAVTDPGVASADRVTATTVTVPADTAPSRSPSPPADDAEDSLTPIPNAIADLEGMDVDEPPRTTGYRDEIQSTSLTGEATLQFDMSRLRSRMVARRARRANNPTSRPSAFSTLANGAVTKAAGVQNRDADEAEAALARVIRKDDFAKMQVLGQFNKGFIIARLRHEADGKSAASDDLFIVDQHASDEKYNFETLQRTTVIKAQALIRPRKMELTAADEIVAMENMDVLHANGFDVEVDEDAPPGRGQRIALKAMPISKETTFDFKDLEQLLHLLSDSARPAGQMVRCTKARAMFAMRACRRSVMIGKSLTKTQMVALLRNMGTIDQPWNCPHGRPTMRHLCSLTQLDHPRSGADRIDWSRWEA